MSVLDSMRRSTDSTTIRVLFGILVLFFIFWGIQANQGRSGQEAATEAIVNGTYISSTQLYREMRLRDRREPGEVSEEDEKQFRLQVLDQLIQEEMLVQEAERLDIEVSDEELARAVLQTPSFKVDGKFNTELYDRALKRMGLTQGKYEDMIRREMQITKLIKVVAAAVQVPEADVKRAYLLDNTTVDLRWVKVPEAALLADVPVQDSEIDALLAKEELKVKTRYDADHDRLYNSPRKAEISAILLRTDIAGADPAATRARAEAIQKEAAAADDAAFAQLARTWSEDLTAVNGGDLGLLAEPLMDPILARAVFEAGAGKTTGIVENGRGLWVARVHRVEEARETPFEEVKRSIARDLVASERVGALTQEYAEKILAAWKASGNPPEDLLLAQELRARDTGSQQLSRLNVPELGDDAGLTAAAKNATGVGVLPAIYPTQGGWVVGAITSYSGADPGQYEAQRDPVYQRVLMMARSRFMQAWLADLKKRSKITNNEEALASTGA